MDKREIEALARAQGFAACYFLPPLDLGAAWARQCVSRPPHTGGLVTDVKSAYPWAKSVLLLVRPYVPFTQSSALPGYYPASNAGYHGTKALCKVLGERGVRALHVELPLSALVAETGIGVLRKNALLELPGFGTRTALFTLVTSACTPATYPPADLPGCDGCTACVRACPAGAIDAQYGLHAQRCLRTYMEGGPMPAYVMGRLPGLLGCEICQYACVRNAHIPTRPPTEEEAHAFDLVRLVKGDVGEARALVGKNMCTKGRLSAQAAVLLGRAGLAKDLVRACLDHPAQPVRHAAAWALMQY